MKYVLGGNGYVLGGNGYVLGFNDETVNPPVPVFTDFETFQHCADYGLTEEIEFNRLRGDFGDGFQSSYLIGANTGNKEWKLNFKVLPQTNNNSISFGGLSLNRADYLWDFYCRHAVSGKPFVIKSPRNEQFYLADFLDERLSFELFAIKLWSTGVRLRQRRMRAVSAFDLMKLKPWAWFAADKFQNFNNGQTVNAWADSSGNGRNLTAIDGGSVPIYGSTAGNATKPGVYWDGTKNGLIHTANANLKNIFIVAKYQDPTFSTYNGLLSALGFPIFAGEPGTTKFLTGSFGELAVYRKNGKELASNNQLAPMSNALGLVSLRLPEGATITGITVGRDRNISATVTHLWKGAIAEIVLFDSLLTETDEREIIEHLLTKYEI